MKFLRRLIPYALVIFALVLVFPLFYGCSGGSQTSNRFHELLGLIPSDVDISSAPIFLNDYASFWEDNGISLVELDEQSITFQGLIDLILEKDNLFTRMSLVQGSDITGWGRYASQELIQDKYVGYSFASINAEIQAGTPPHEMVAAIGRFDPKATGDALNHQDEWPSWAIEAYDTEEYSGVTIHSWGDGLRMHIDPNRDPVGTPPHIDMLGRAMPLAVTSDYLFYTSSLDGIKSMIDSS